MKDNFFLSLPAVLQLQRKKTDTRALLLERVDQFAAELKQTVDTEKSEIQEQHEQRDRKRSLELLLIQMGRPNILQ